MEPQVLTKVNVVKILRLYRDTLKNTNTYLPFYMHSVCD